MRWLVVALVLAAVAASPPAASAGACGSTGGGDACEGARPGAGSGGCAASSSGGAAPRCGSGWVGAAAGTTAGLGVVGALAFAFKGALVGLFTRLRPDRLLGHPMRARLHAAVASQPGITYQELRAELGCGKGTLEHHLGVLLRHGRIERLESAGRASYAVPGAVPGDLGRALPALRSEPARRIALALLEPATTPELCKAVGLSGSTVHFHRRRLVAAGVVGNAGTAARPRWRLTPLGRQALGASPSPMSA